MISYLRCGEHGFFVHPSKLHVIISQPKIINTWYLLTMLMLECMACKTEYEDSPRYICERCFAPLQVKYDWDSIQERVTREREYRGEFTACGGT
jgi:hypothetical protein